MLRFICSFSAATNSEVWSGDLSSAFLLAKGDRPIYVYPPTWFKMLYSSWDDLAVMQKSFLQILETKGKKAMNATCRHQGQVEEVLELLSAVYGNLSATRLFQNKNTKVITKDCGLLKIMWQVVCITKWFSMTMRVEELLKLSVNALWWELMLTIFC